MDLICLSLSLLRCHCCDNAVVFVVGGVPLFHEGLLSRSSDRVEGRTLFKKSLSFLSRAAKLLCRSEAASARAHT